MTAVRRKDCCSCGRHYFRRVGSYLFAITERGYEPVELWQMPVECAEQLRRDMKS